MLLIQEYLLNHSLSDLAKEHGVYARVHDYKASFNYDQIEAKDNDPLACECRGLILRTYNKKVFPSENEIVGETKVLAFPMKRFFNFGQGSAASVNFDDPSTLYLEKVDGTCIIVYYDDVSAQICVATRSVPEANLPIDGYGDITFRDLFETALLETISTTFDYDSHEQNLIDAWYRKLSTRYTYVFELTTPRNQVVVRHNENRVTLLTMRHAEFSKEDPYQHLVRTAKELSVPVVPSYKIGNLEELIKFVNSRNPSEHEGVVVCDKNFNRVKVKSAAYVAAHRAKSLIGSSPRNLLELILLGQVDDIMPLLVDEQKIMAEEMQKKLRDYINHFNETWEELYLQIPNHLSEKVRRKEFAIYVQTKSLWMAPAMICYEGKAKNLNDYFLKQIKNGQHSQTFLDKLLVEIK